MQTLLVKTDRRTQLLDVTAQVQNAVSASEVSQGICYLFVPHTTAAVTINENADPDVARDIESAFDRLVPKAGPYHHSEGNSDSHIKSVLVGASQTIFVENGRLALGRWQGIFFCEFDGPRERKLVVKVVAAKGNASFQRRRSIGSRKGKGSERVAEPRGRPGTGVLEF